MNFRLLHGALNDLDDIDEWVTEHFGPSFAARTYAKLFAEFALLVEFPKMGRERPDVTAKPVRHFLSGQYWIVYEPGNPLLIHRVFHGARDLSEIALD